MDDLIKALEAATRGHRNLDADLYQALGFQVVRTDVSLRGRGIAWRWFNEESRRWEVMRNYTTSVDDALKLRPKGSLWFVSSMELGPRAVILPPKADGGFVGSVSCEAEAATPALALCIAALRSRTGAAS